MTHIEKLAKAVREFRECERGTTAIEYGIIGVAVSTSIAYGATAIGTANIVTLEYVTSIWPE